MNRPSRLALFTALFCGSFFVSAAQEKYPPTLLWRISGNHLAKPSYLYGTMHLADRRLFYFGDSLYSCLEKADGYAMEVNPDTAVNALFRSIFARDTSGLVKDAMDKKKFSGMARRLETELGVPADKVTKKQLWLYSYKGGKGEKAEDMDAPVDTYLYNIAKRQGKWVGGIEDIEDQLFLLEDNAISGLEPGAAPRKTKSKTSTENMIDLYISQDLGKIDNWTSINADSAYREKLLYHRNIKMAYRIDSMAAVRSHFFAVGAAHLPGKRGLLALLKARGFTVEPILSSKKIAPEAYTYKAIDLPWLKQQDDEKTYTMEMPGKAFPLKLPNDMTMQCYADLGTGIIYFSMAVQYPMKVGSTDSVLASVAKNIAHNGTVEKQQSIRSGEAQGIELISGKDNYYYRIRTYLKGDNLYMVMVGSEKKTLLKSKEGERFFNSFVMADQPKAPARKNNDWMAFTLPEKGFTIALPGQPERNKQMEQVFHKSPNSANWGFVCYGYSDAATGNYYLVSVKETLHGYYLINDTSIFHDARENTIKQGSTILLYDIVSCQGYPAAKMDALYGQTNLIMNCLNVCRANRVYTIMALSEKGKGDTAAIGRFMHSFRLLDNLPARWSEQSSPDGSFHAWAPSALGKIYYPYGKDFSHHVMAAYDSFSTVSYMVNKEAISPWYWTGSDSSYFADGLKEYLEWNDSVLSKKAVENGGIKGMEYLIRHRGSNNLKRLRILSNGDTTYRLYGYIPRQLQQDVDIDRFFTSFRFNHANNSKPYLVNKAAALLSALRSPDSATFSRASAALGSAHFTHSDLPLLCGALLYTYKDSAQTFYNTTHRIVLAAAKLRDTSVNAFVASHYASMGGDKEKLKYSLLSLLLETRTQSSYDLFKKLLLQQPPREGNPNSIRYQLTDSMQLAVSLFPGLLPAGKDTLFIQILPYTLMRLIDSNLIAPVLLMPYKNDYYALARKELKRLDTVSADYLAEPLVQLLGRLKDAEATALLQQFLRVKQLNIKQEAALALIKSSSTADPQQLEKIAADDGMRISLYKELVKCGKENLFPAKYHFQLNFAASELYELANDAEYDSVTVNFLDLRSSMFMKQQQAFYLFTVTVTNDDGDRVSHLGIAGPYDAMSKKLLTTSDAADINWDEPYDTAKLNKQYHALLESGEAYMKKREEKK